MSRLCSLYPGSVVRSRPGCLPKPPSPWPNGTSQVLRTHGGVAPVTRQSGKRRQVVMRRGVIHACGMRCITWRASPCNVMCTSAKCMRLWAKGHRHGQALRTIGDRLLRIQMAMLRERICYDASRMHREPVVQMG